MLQSPGPGHPALGILPWLWREAVPYRARKRAREPALPKLPEGASAVPAGRRFTATRSLGRLQRKSLVQHLGRTLSAARAKGQLLVRLGSSRLRRAFQGTWRSMGVVKGQGPEGAVGIRTLPVS